jgi:hypothetical protein
MASRLTCASTDSGRARYAYCMPNSNQFCERLCGGVTPGAPLEGNYVHGCCAPLTTPRWQAAHGPE